MIGGKGSAGSLGALHLGLQYITRSGFSCPTMYWRDLAKWTAVTMATAQQTHDILTVYCVRGMAVLLVGLTGDV